MNDFFRIEFFYIYLFEVFTPYNILGTYITSSILFYFIEGPYSLFNK